MRRATQTVLPALGQDAVQQLLHQLRCFSYQLANTPTATHQLRVPACASITPSFISTERRLSSAAAGGTVEASSSALQQPIPSSSVSPGALSSTAAQPAQVADASAEQVRPPGWLGRTPKKPDSSGSVGFIQILLTKRGPDGQRVPRPWWERLYWGAGITGISYWAWSRWHRSRQVDPAVTEAQEKAKAELHAKRVSGMRALLAGKSFLEEGNPFEGMTPKEIMVFMKDNGLNPYSDDPFEGLSPEEIDEYARLHGLEP